jgi:tRNA threonylcarbamoyladenosine modification (KEOPS) complex  Pcc1 subunit
VALNPSGVAGTSYLRLRLGSDEEAKLLYSALLPETESVPSDRASTTIAVEGSDLVVEIRADDLTALRASMNSFLSWISACMRALDSMDSATTQNP